MESPDIWKNRLENIFRPDWAVWTFVKAILGAGSAGPAAR